LCKTEQFSSTLSSLLCESRTHGALAEANLGSNFYSVDNSCDEKIENPSSDIANNKPDFKISDPLDNTSSALKPEDLDKQLRFQSGEIMEQLQVTSGEYKPSDGEEWDDLETFNEQIENECKSIVDSKRELQELHQEAMIPIEDLLREYKLREKQFPKMQPQEDIALSASSSQSRANKFESNTAGLPSVLLKHGLRDYQQFGLEWLVSCHASGVNAMLADEMGLGKTIQTISLLAHLACQCGIWGPHLIVVPTSVMVNWEVEFKKWCPAMKILTYFGSQKERKLKRKGWSKPYSFHVCITTYRLAVQDQSIFRRKRWHYIILDEAHMIKNWRSQRWQTLLTFESAHRLLVTGTPLQNDVMELWALLHFLMPNLFQSHSEFKSWFSNPLLGMSEGRTAVDTRLTARLHAVLRPFILRRLKQDVERSLPAKCEHIIKCRLSRRQKRLYDEYMSSHENIKTLASSNTLGVMNCLMQLRKVCNHPDLFAGRSIISAFDMPGSLLVLVPAREGLTYVSPAFRFSVNSRGQLAKCNETTKSLSLHFSVEHKYSNLVAQEFELYRTSEISTSACLNVQRPHDLVYPRLSALKVNLFHLNKGSLLDRESLRHLVLKFMFRIPKVRARTPQCTSECSTCLLDSMPYVHALLRPIRSLLVRTQLVFPDVRLVQFDCGKLQTLAELLRSLKAGGHKVVIFTQMTKVLDILEKFLNLYSYSYVRLDGTTKPEQRQILMQRFNSDTKLFAFILSTRSGGFGINLTGADTVIFYDSDWNPAVDSQAQDRCHRIGQTRQVNIYRLISEDTIEENIFQKALQKRELDELAIQKGNFNSLLIPKTGKRRFLLYIYSF